MAWHSGMADWLAQGTLPGVLLQTGAVQDSGFWIRFLTAVLYDILIS